MCTYRTGLQRYKARSTKANLQHVWILPWWTPPGWDRKTGAAPYQILTVCQELMCCTMLCLHFTHFQCCFQLNWNGWASCFDRMQSKLFRTSLSRLEHVSTSALLYHCVCMRLLTENVNLHHASWFQSFSILQIMNYGSFFGLFISQGTNLTGWSSCFKLCLHCAHSGLWVFFLPFLIWFSLLSSVSPSLTFPVYSTGIRMKIPLLWNTTSRGSPMKFERRSWCTCRRRTSQKSRMCTAMFPTHTFHRLR